MLQTYYKQTLVYQQYHVPVVSTTHVSKYTTTCIPVRNQPLLNMRATDADDTDTDTDTDTDSDTDTDTDTDSEQLTDA